LGVVNGTYHYQLYDVAGKYIRSLSKGNHDDTYAYKYFSNGKVYIQSAGPHNSERTIHEVNIETGEEKLFSSSKLMKREGKYFTASFNQNSKYSILISNGPDLPEYVIKNNDNMEDIAILESNEEAEKNRKDFGFPSSSFQTITIVQNEDNENRTESTFELLIQYPPKFIHGKSYPTVLNVYNGPGSQQVVKTFSRTSTGINSILASQGFVVVSMDGRGTGYKGEKYMHQVYKKLGAFDAEDTLMVGKWILDQNFSKKKHVSLWGWSYGGLNLLIIKDIPASKLISTPI
jgi:dipeptidyl aminopeptidase/acylaminoacyl peptidase